MTPSTYLKIFSALTSVGDHDLAGTFLSRHSCDIHSPRSRDLHPIPLDVAKRYTPKSTHDIAAHLKDTPILGLYSSFGRQYRLSPLQRLWFRARYDLTPTDTIILVAFTPRDEDPSVVDQCIIESLITADTSSRTRLLHRCCFTWADLMAHDCGDSPFSGISKERVTPPLWGTYKDFSDPLRPARARKSSPTASDSDADQKAFLSPEEVLRRLMEEV